VKIGVLPNKELAIIIATWLGNLPKRPFVIVDSVLNSSSDGGVFGDQPLVSILSPLLAMIDLLTPNHVELEQLVICNKCLKAHELITKFSKENPRFIGKFLLTGGHHPHLEHSHLVTNHLFDLRQDNVT